MLGLSLLALFGFIDRSSSLDVFGLQFEDYDFCYFGLSDNHGIKSHFNLSAFYLTGESFLVDDDEIVDWKYRFNVCGRIDDRVWFAKNDTIPEYCKTQSGTSDPCDIRYITDEGNCEHKLNTSFNIAASAVQINEKHEVCHWLASEVDGHNGPDWNVTLYDSEDSASGIVYRIFNGEWCQPGGINRELKLELICPDSPRNWYDPSQEASFDEVVVEYPTCVYTISYESPLACPADCISKASNSEHAVCHTHGICVSDPNYGAARCICDDGWEGDLCNIETTASEEVNRVSNTHSGLIAVVIICIILLIIALGVAIYLCHRIRLKEDQVAGKHGQLAQGMLEADQMLDNPTDASGTSMGIVGSSNFDPNRSNNDEVAQVAIKHEKEITSGNNDNNNNEEDMLQHGDEQDDVVQGNGADGGDDDNNNNNDNNDNEDGGNDDGNNNGDNVVNIEDNTHDLLGTES